MAFILTGLLECHIYVMTSDTQCIVMYMLYIMTNDLEKSTLWVTFVAAAMYT